MQITVPDAKVCITQCPGKALTFVGNMMELDEVMEEVLKDMDFYQESKGESLCRAGKSLYSLISP